MDKNILAEIIGEYKLEDFLITRRTEEYIDHFPELRRYVQEFNVCLDASVDTVTYTVDPNFVEPYPLDLSDLARIHFLTLKTKPLSVLELGSGHSTFFFAHALMLLKKTFSDDVRAFNRVVPAFHIHSVDESSDFLKVTKNRMPNSVREHVSFYQSDVEIVEFRLMPVMLYKVLPDVAVDLIYVDGPSQFSVPDGISLGGLTFRQAFRLPNAADVLRLEYFLEPGALVLIDGRTTNARFLKHNLSRSWESKHCFEGDFHLFLLNEYPLGELNRKKNRFRGVFHSDWIGLSSY